MKSSPTASASGRNDDSPGGHEKSEELKAAAQIAKAIPKESWNQIVNTACVTFERVVAPLTSATNGIGELIAARFDRLTSLEKVNTAAVLEKYNEFTASREGPEIGEAMLDGVAVFRESLASLDDESVVVFTIA